MQLIRYRWGKALSPISWTVPVRAYEIAATVTSYSGPPPHPSFTTTVFLSQINLRITKTCMFHAVVELWNMLMNVNPMHSWWENNSYQEEVDGNGQDCVMCVDVWCHNSFTRIAWSLVRLCILVYAYSMATLVTPFFYANTMTKLCYISMISCRIIIRVGVENI